MVEEKANLATYRTSIFK